MPLRENPNGRIAHRIAAFGAKGMRIRPDAVTISVTMIVTVGPARVANGPHRNLPAAPAPKRTAKATLISAGVSDARSKTNGSSARAAPRAAASSMPVAVKAPYAPGFRIPHARNLQESPCQIEWVWRVTAPGVDAANWSRMACATDPRVTGTANA